MSRKVEEQRNTEVSAEAIPGIYLPPGLVSHSVLLKERSTNVKSRYFGAEFATAVLLVLGKCRVIQYYPTLIVLDFVSLFADSWLLSFLLVIFASRLYGSARKDNLTPALFAIYCWVLGIVAVVNIPAFLWKGVINIIGADTQAALEGSGGIKFKILGSYQALNVSFYGLYFGGIIGLAWITFSCLRKLGSRARSLKILLSITVVCLAIRTAGKFLYSILFVLQARTKSPLMVFIHTLFYGLLSVLIYGTIFFMLRSDCFNEGLEAREGYGEHYHLASHSSLQEGVYKPPQKVQAHESEIVNVAEPPPPRHGHAAEYYFGSRAH